MHPSKASIQALWVAAKSSPWDTWKLICKQRVLPYTPRSRKKLLAPLGRAASCGLDPGECCPYRVRPGRRLVQNPVYTTHLQPQPSGLPPSCWEVEEVLSLDSAMPRQVQPAPPEMVFYGCSKCAAHGLWEQAEEGKNSPLLTLI